METAEIRYLPDQQKRDLCLELLDEFGAGKVRERGPELHHNCTLPFNGHTDNNSYAASVNYKDLVFNCYVCGHGGPLSWWIAVNRGEDTDAVEPWLRKKLGIGSSLPLSDLLRVIDEICRPTARTKVLPKYPAKILDRWTDWPIYHPYLTDPPSQGGRGIPEENLERFHIGYADEDLDFGYHQRIIVPAFWKNELVGWQARALSPDDPEYRIKYKNSVGFPRDFVLFADPESTRNGPPRHKRAVLVESPLSVLRQCGNVPVVATFGSNVTPDQLRCLEGIDDLVIFNENDKAGWKMIRHVSRALSRKVRVSVVQNPYNKKYDPADFDDDTFMNLVDGAVPAAVWQPNMQGIEYQFKESGNVHKEVRNLR
jgi:hypothetical protein